MPRLLGVEIPGRKRIEYSLQYIHGIGPARAAIILREAQVDPASKADDLSPEELRKLIEVIQNGYRTEGDLCRETSSNIRCLISIGSYRGLRHRRGLPCRGQRTSTNARTRKGPKRTVGAVRGKEARSAVKSETK